MVAEKFLWSTGVLSEVLDFLEEHIEYVDFRHLI